MIGQTLTMRSAKFGYAAGARLTIITMLDSGKFECRVSTMYPKTAIKFSTIIEVPADWLGDLVDNG